MPNPFRGSRETVSEQPADSESSLWARFDAEERQRRIQAFIEDDAAAARRKWEDLPLISQRKGHCGRCGQDRQKQVVSTELDGSTDYEITVRESEDGEVVLGCVPYNWATFSSYSLMGMSRGCGPIFQKRSFTTLVVTCECGKRIGVYRPLEEA